MVFILALLLAAQAPAPEAPAKAVLTNTGQPLRVPFQCGEEDIRAFGLTCPPRQPCAVYLELSNVHPVGNKLFLTGNLHTEAATLFSILLASEDEGRTWSEPCDRIRSAGLDQIQFLDSDTGWISGQTLAAVPRDPFLLLTRDGGKTWQSRPIWDDSRVGLIEGFRFDSKTHGLLWIDRTQAGENSDRYESYESLTGGETWALRQTSGRPIRKAERPPASAGWRLRAESRSHSYLLERQEGPHWQRVASFLIDVGACREPEIKLPPPPPEEPKPEEAKPAEPAPAPRTPPTLNKKKPGS